MKYLVVYDRLDDQFEFDLIEDSVDSTGNLFRFFDDAQALVDWLCRVSQNICIFYVSLNEDYADV